MFSTHHRRREAVERVTAEARANPRDTEEHTENGRGFSPKRCRAIFRDADMGLLEGPSVYYQKR